MRKMEEAGVQMTDIEIDAVAGGDLVAAGIAIAVASLPPPPPPPADPCVRDGKLICTASTVRG